MNWKQTIGLVISVGAIIALCFLVIFPALYDKEEPQESETQVKSDVPSEDEDRSVLPKLKGVNWETAPQSKKPAEKKPAKKIVKEPSVVAELGEIKEPAKSISIKMAPKSLLELQEMVWYEQEGYVVVTGTVKNISGLSLPTVQAHVTLEGEEGWYISEEHAMIELNPIFPGQISAFTVISRYYPELRNVVLDFRKFSGESIPWSKSEALKEAEQSEASEEGDSSADEEALAPDEGTAQPLP